MSKSNRPHMVIINPDQWRGDVLGHVGNPAAVTPVLDNLVQSEAISFSNSFCQNTVCVPSRCSFLTGQYPHTLGHRTMHHMIHTQKGETTMLKVLKEQGYFVWWGDGNDTVSLEEGFEEHCDIKYKRPPEAEARLMPNIHFLEHKRGEPDGDNYYSFYIGELKRKDGEKDYFDGDWCSVDGAIEFIEKYDENKPLCLYLTLGYPHPPYACEEPWYSATDRGALPPRRPTPKSWDMMPSLLKGIHERQGLQEWSEERWNELRGTYYGMCARQDYLIGKVISALRKKGMWDDTAFFMLSDHGDYTGDYGIAEKTQNTPHDSIARVPFIIKPPKSENGKPRVCKALTELVDFPATVYDFAGIDDPGYDHFGKSLRPLLRGETEEHRDAAFCEGGRLYGETQAMEGYGENESKSKKGWYYPRLSLQGRDDGPFHTKATMCRTKTMKYIRRHYETDELYDLKKDPDELVNVINDPSYASELVALKERMLTWYMETCDVVPRKTDCRW